ncbi:mannose-6-phosphate isomerase, class I [Williamsia phyllosphaerae]|uniref:mannose-6-phosphate isomerase n=1 Tax=Williamsia phyllosphaerae TaxID=885042 RepID=A0ABQ1UWC8_9NOCA|nr:mannose-6-phosphate isomerase, class I [Williamsia phyllosphaerae]GGF27134.1 putative mannose-6-phosphate isomerase ManA [Williamsia phyllosphaerae]
MRLLEGIVRPYAWGSRTALAAMRGRPTPSPHPEAELWFGAHPGAPSVVVDDEATDAPADLLSVIDTDPRGELGGECAQTFADRLPFLVKILAADEPLSLQAHPTLAQARAGFARENAAGIPVGATNRNYRDDNHKPELVVALTEFDALAGFRDPATTIELLRDLQVAELDPYLGLLAGQPDSDGLRALFTTWLTLPDVIMQALIPPVLEGAIAYLGRSDRRFTRELQTVLELGEAYPMDPGVLTVLLLNRIRLMPGEGLYLGAGNLHAYLRGTAVEVMANSDNVLRGGLTPKHMDVPELLAVLDFTPTAPSELLPGIHTLGAERIYSTPASEFRLSRVELDGTGLQRTSSISFDVAGPQILTVIAGTIEIRTPDGRVLSVPAGSSAWLGDSDPDVVVRAASSRSVFFRALVPGVGPRTEESGQAGASESTSRSH